MTTSLAGGGIESVPRAGFIPGLGAGGDCKLVEAFMRQALQAGYFPVAPDIIDITDSENLSIIPPLDIEADRAQPALDCDIVVIHSAGILVASRAIERGWKVRPDQRLVCLAPSTRNPGTTYDKYAKPLDELWAKFGLDSVDRIEMEDVAYANGYPAPLLVMPGAGDVSRPIAISEAAASETYGLNPPKMLAALLGTFAVNGVGAWIKRWQKDTRLDVGTDIRSGKTHAMLLEVASVMFRSEVQVAHGDPKVSVEIMPGGSHFFNKETSDGTPGEDAVMADILSGALYDRVMSEEWKRDGVFLPQVA